MGQFSVTVLAVAGSNLSGNQQPMRRLPAGENDAQMSQTAHVFGDPLYANQRSTKPKWGPLPVSVQR